MDAAACEREMDSDRMQQFLVKTLPLVEQALQQNETLDIFLDPFAHLLEEDAAMANKSEAAVKELRSFTDLVYSKNKTLPAVDWHPKKHGVVAVAAAANVNFARRLDLLDKIDSSYILIWNFADLIHPQLMLEAPQDALSLRFNPTNPHIVAAGLHNGQVLVWDYSRAENSSSALKAKSAASAGKTGAAANDPDEAPKQIPPVKPLHVSYIDASHRRPVTDLLWLPTGMEVTNRGHLVPAQDATVNQFVTIAGDGQVAFWDLRFKDPKYRGLARGKVDKAATLAAKDMTPEVHFTPIYAITLGKVDTSGELGLQCICFERPRDDLGSAAPASSRFYCGTEEGEFVYADWRPHAATPATSKGARDDDNEPTRGGGDDSVQYVQWLHRDHSRPILALCASPFFPAIFLTASESHFHLWNVAQPQQSAAPSTSSSSSQQQSKDGQHGSAPQQQQHGPIFVSPLASATITCAAFSPSRPAVIFLGKSDGVLEVWDFLDQSHRPSLTLGVTACALTSIAFRPPVGSAAASSASAAASGATSTAGKASAPSTTPAGAAGAAQPPQQQAKQQLVAIGDQIGNLHILEVPRSLARAFSGEKQSVEAYFKRESARARAAQAVAAATTTMGDAPRLTATAAGSVRDHGGHEAPSTAQATMPMSPGAGVGRGTPGGEKDADDEVFKRLQDEFCREMGTLAPA